MSSTIETAASTAAAAASGEANPAFVDEADYYNKASIPKVEKAVEALVTSGQYLTDTVLTLMRLYQFYPEARNDSCGLKALILAMLSDHDFTSVLALCNDEFFSHPMVVKLREVGPFGGEVFGWRGWGLMVGGGGGGGGGERQGFTPYHCLFRSLSRPFGADSHRASLPPTPARQLSELLETANFAEFWKQVEDARESLKLIPDFDARAQKKIYRIVSITYNLIEAVELAGYLNMGVDAATGSQQLQDKITKFGTANGIELQFVEAEGEGAAMVQLPLNSENSQRPAKFREQFSFEQMSSLMTHMGQANV